MAKTVELTLPDKTISGELQQQENIARLPTQHLQAPKKSWQGLFGSSSGLAW